jgi:hypothetical protein
MSFSLKILNNDLNIVQGKLQTVINSEKLIQQILKICLTEVGGNPLHPSYGSFLSRSVVGSALASNMIVQIAQSQINTCLQNLQTIQQLQLKSFQKVSADEQLGAVLGISVIRSNLDPRLFNININVLTKGFMPVSTAFTASTI